MDLRAHGRLAAPFAILLICGCTCATRDGGVEAEVSFSGFKPACIEVVATDVESSANRGATSVTVSEARLYVIGIGPGTGWSQRWSVSVLAHEATCTGRVVAQETQQVDVPSGAVARLSFALTATDADGDGYVALPQGSDCDDARGEVSPAALEVCDDGSDNDCDGARDCADGTCLGSACDDTDFCTVSDVCAADGGCGGAPRDCGPSGRLCHQDAGSCTNGACFWPVLPVGTPCGAGLACRQDGVCVNASGELDCANGLDDDLDGLPDCRDPDCNAAGCDGGLCFQTGSCMSGACMALPKMCPAPPTCRGAGTCDSASGACSYPLAPPGTACNDGNSCSQLDRCDGTGSCLGSPMPCTGCTACDAGACVPTTGACDDGMACTSSDMCTSGTCSGTPYTCTATPPECRMNACAGDGGCLFVTSAVLEGTACTGGTCRDGGCAPAPPDAGAQDAGFAYSPSNVTLSSVPPSGDVVLNCAVTFDSTDGGVSPSWCGGPAPVIYSIIQSGGEPATVLSMRSLFVTSTGVLTLRGSAPVIVLVHATGVTQIDGQLLADGTAGQPGAGGDRASCGAQNGNVGSQGNGRGSGGGGAGFATAGGNGGTGDQGQNDVPGGTGGVTRGASLSPLIGGCRGGRGGGTSPGTPGAGGGGLQLSVAGELRLGSTARMSVSGGGGAAVVADSSGGGGGGSAGMLLLEADTLTLDSATAWLTANGGAAGQGATNGTAGQPGQDGPNAAATAAQGGNGPGAGGRGGNGAAAMTGPTAGGPSAAGGGGGGGAAGRIYLRAISSCTATASISPPAPRDAGCP